MVRRTALLGLCALCAGCSLDWSGEWTTPRSDLRDALLTERGVLSDGLHTEIPSPLGPCSAPASVAEVAGWSPSMKTCTGTEPVSQCMASASCNAAQGWHLCSTSEYYARGGSGAGPRQATWPAWIAGCVRAAVAAEIHTLPSVCPTCRSIMYPPLSLHTSCSQHTPGPAWTTADVGVAAAGECNQLVSDSFVGMWETLPAVTALTSVVCCH